MPGTRSKSVSRLAKWVSPWCHMTVTVSIAVQQFRLPTQVRGQGYKRRVDAVDAHASGVNLINPLPREDQLLNLGRVAAKAIGDPLDGPAETVGGFDGHQAVDHFPKNVCRRNRRDFLIFGTVEEHIASRAVNGVVGQREDKNVGVHEDYGADGDVRERHADSIRPLSSDKMR